MRVYILLVAVLSLTFIAPGGATESEGGRYVAGNGQFVIWCSAEPHSLIREPECAGADAYNAVNGLAGNDREALGIGGFVIPYGPEDALTTILVAPVDDVTGANVYLILQGPQSESGGEGGHSEGCGPQMIQIPADPIGQIVGRIPALAISEDLDVCAATTGKY